ncbi:hypothetical protein ETD86_40865 [Nonomuraea turkmeniaca]|uniref:Uncharacterized protein n=1 Tax=Nonomuraea turkmeniaca TaxID=103838 RepID=A0A5S4FLR9_9ACTN|nr:hypothetical protein [Nonomuraea turkmeniaca]TMR10079.1 hypothetical protein ETD86_40865 [Nonomuraea turkmeniaca]
MDTSSNTAPMAGRMRDQEFCCPGHDPMFSRSRTGRHNRRKWVRIQRRRVKRDLARLIAEATT